MRQTKKETWVLLTEWARENGVPFQTAKDAARRGRMGASAKIMPHVERRWHVRRGFTWKA